jgi:CRISPR-associated endonuclease/helicase Cas3
MSRELFGTMFQRAMGEDTSPLPYQERLATEDRAMSLLLDVPTGLGKTAAAILAWLWRRRFHPEQAVRDHTLRRLVYCLPIRVLVEQSHRQTTKWLKNLNLWSGPEQESTEWTKDEDDYGTHPIYCGLMRTDRCRWRGCSG